MTYIARVVDATLDQMLTGLPAIAIEGPRAVGKTATGRRRAQTIVSFDNPADLALARSEWGRVTRLTPPVFLDEWQLFPSAWDQVRRAVDAGAAPGSFLLAGSAAPRQAPTHSGAGRIVTLRMRPLSLAERGLVTPTVSLGDLLSGSQPRIEGTTALTVSDYATEVTASGLPGIRTLLEPFRSQALDSYLDLVVEHDFAESGHSVRQPQTLRRWLAAYAAATSTTAAYNVILNAATAGESDKPTRATTEAYRETLERIWLLDEVPAWLGPRRHLAALGAKPKHHLADPALAARLLGAGPQALVDRPDPGRVSLVRPGTLFGALFESLATLSVRVYAAAHFARVSHFRTSRGDHEVDLVVERDDGRIVAIEVKLADALVPEDTKHLAWLSQQLGDDLLDAVVLTTGQAAYRRDDGIAVIPAALLGP